MGDDPVVDQLLPHLPATPLRLLYVGPGPAAVPDVLLARAQSLTVTPPGARVFGSYDLVCAHRALLAVDDLRGAVVPLCDAVAPGGVVSLLAAGPRLEELASYVAGRRMHVAAWFGVGAAATRRDAPVVHVVGRRDGGAVGA